MLYFDGILTHGRLPNRTDADAMLEAFLGGGLEVMHTLEGFYNVLLLHEERDEAVLLSDPLCTRPWYLYRHEGTIAAAPTPLAFAAWGLPMSLDRLELFHGFRFSHSSFGRTLVREVERLRPGIRYAWKNGELSEERYLSFAYREDRRITFDESVERVKGFFADVMQGTLTHPRLAHLPIHLPLTAGLDSRHILGELLAQGRPPAALRHILFRQADYEPVRLMADGLGLPLLVTSTHELDWPRLVERWAERSAGLVNVHQAYLLEMASRVPPGGAVGFNGYLMDLLMAINTVQTLRPGADPTEHVWNRHYTRRFMLQALLPHAGALAEDSLDRFKAVAAQFDGPDWYKAALLDVHHRGLHYTGPMDSMFADEALYFSPGAHVRSLDYFLTVPRDVGGNRRARLEAMRRYFPDLAAYPDAYGRPYAEYETLVKSSGSRMQYVRPVLRAIFSGLRHDPAPESEHAWLRQIPSLGRMHRRVAYEGALARDGHVRGAATRTCWRLLQAGGYQAWTLMALFSAEVAYRTLVRREPLGDVVAWLRGADAP